MAKKKTHNLRVCFTQINLFVLFSRITVVSKNHNKPTNTLCGKKY
jgi:hypothetical protein